MGALFFRESQAPQSLIPAGYSLQVKHRGPDTRLAIVDTYDWRIWNAGFSALEDAENLELRKLDTWAMEGERTGHLVEEGTLPETCTRDKLQKIIYPRALVRRFEIDRRVERCVIRNADEKIVCGAEVISLTLESTKSSKALGIVFFPLRGYEDETREIEQFARRTAEPCPAAEGTRREIDPLSLLLEKEKENPATFVSHKSLRLESGAPLREASRNLLLRFAEVMANCVPGILADTDTEFLHDYRVCVRKARAFLTLVKSSLDIDAIAPHLDFVKSCGEMTTGMRDLDVYLLEYPRFYSALPPSLNVHLEAFYDEIQAKRVAEKKLLSERLSSATYKAGFSSWRKYLASGRLIAAGTGADSDMLGRRLIARKYKKVRGLASRITDHTSDPDLHSLRIECKKLRYCIEFFKGAVHEPVVDEVLSLLKTLQDVLGEFNDLSVQQRWLHDALHSQDVVRAPGVQAAIGGLMTSLFTKQQGLRRQIYERFSSFIDESVAFRIMELKATRGERH